MHTYATRTTNGGSKKEPLSTHSNTFCKFTPIYSKGEDDTNDGKARISLKLSASVRVIRVRVRVGVE